MELTLENLAAKIDAQDKVIEAQNDKIDAQAKLIDEQGSLIKEQAEKIGKLELQKAELGAIVLEAKKEVVKPTIPEELVVIGKKKYKWLYPTFRLLGDSTLYIAAEAALDPSLINRILAIKGQNVLVEQA